MNRDEAWTIVTEYTASDSLRKHMLSVEAAMRAYAPRYEGDIESRKGGLFFTTGEGLQVRLIDDHLERMKPYEGKTVHMGVRPENLHDKLYASNATPDNTVTGRVEVVQPLGSITEVYVTVGRTPLIAQVEATDQVEVNQDIDIVFDMSKAHFFDPQTEVAIV